MLYNPKALMAFHYDSLNSHVPVFNVMEFLVNTPQATKQ